MDKNKPNQTANYEGLVAAGAEPLAAPKPANDMLERNSLRLAGMLNLVGDVGFLINGIKTADPYKFTGGLSYTLGGLNLTYYGGVDKQHVVYELVRKTGEYMEDRCGQLPEGCQITYLMEKQPESMLVRMDRFLHQKPAQHTMFLYTIGAGALLGSGIKSHQAGEGSAGLFYGLSSLGFKVTSMLIPEKAVDDPHKSTGFIGWIQEKPLRLFGYSSLVTDSLLTWKSYQEYKHNPGKSGYLWTALSGGTYMLSDLMMAISHKDPANGAARFTETEKSYVTQVVTDAIAKLPAIQQPPMIREVAGFLAQQPELHESKTHLEEMMTQALKEKQKLARKIKSENDVGYALAV